MKSLITVILLLILWVFIIDTLGERNCAEELRAYTTDVDLIVKVCEERL